MDQERGGCAETVGALCARCSACAQGRQNDMPRSCPDDLRPPGVARQGHQGMLPCTWLSPLALSLENTKDLHVAYSMTDM
jgi:hypothetical protein